MPIHDRFFVDPENVQLLGYVPLTNLQLERLAVMAETIALPQDRLDFLEAIQRRDAEYICILLRQHQMEYPSAY